MNHEKSSIEKKLMHRLLVDPSDMLIVETLAFLKSKPSLGILRNLLDKTTDLTHRVILAASIYHIEKDDAMGDVALSAFNELETFKSATSVHKIASLFNDLAKFKTEKTDTILWQYSQYKNETISKHAKDALARHHLPKRLKEQGFIR